MPPEVTLGPVTPCESPAATAWEEVEWGAADYPAPTNPDHVAIEPGGVALVDTGSRRLLYWVPAGGGAAHGVDLTTFERLPELGRSVGALAQADVDGDGNVDLLAVGGETHVVWSVGTDEEDPQALSVKPGARDVAVSDFDGDGDADLLLAYSDAESRPEAMRYELARNDGRRQLVAIGVDAPPDEFWGPAFDVTAADLDRDGALDAYTCNDRGGAGFRNGLLTWRGDRLEVGDARGADVSLSCMGTTIGDLDADGDLDLYLADAFRHWLLRDEDGFVETASAYGLVPFRDQQMSWGAVMEDLDNDGLSDLIVATGDFLTEGWLPFPVELYLQRAPGHLAKTDSPFPKATVGRGVVARDWTGDGVLDVVIGDGTREPHVFESLGCSEGAWLAIVAPAGTLVRVEAGGGTWAALVTTESGFASSGPGIAHVGLGGAVTVDAVELIAPGVAPARVEGPFEPRRTLTYAP